MTRWMVKAALLFGTVACQHEDASELFVPSGALPPDCATLQKIPTDFTGRYDVTWTMEDSEFRVATEGASTVDSGRPWLRAGGWDSDSFEVFRGADRADISRLSSTPLPLDFGVVGARYWVDDVFHDSMLCFGSGTIAASDAAGYEIRSDAVRVLERREPFPSQTRLGTPVEGELTLCSGCAVPLSGELDGAALDATGFSIKAEYNLSEVYSARSDQFVVLVESTQGEFEPPDEGGRVTATLVTFPDSPQGAAIYYAGSESTWAVQEGMVFTLKNFYKLGDCGPQAGKEEALVCGNYSE